MAKLLVMCRITTRLSGVRIVQDGNYITLSTNFARSWRHSVSAGRRTPSRSAEILAHIQHINALLYVTLRGGAGRGSNRIKKGTETECRIFPNVRSDLSRVHRGSRTERREFASLEPRKGEVRLAATMRPTSSCDAVTSSSRTRGVGLEEVRVGSRYVTAVPFWEVPDNISVKGSKRKTRHPLITPRR